MHSPQGFFSLVILCASAVEYFLPQSRKECRDFFLLLFFCVSAVENAFTAKTPSAQRFFALIILCVSAVRCYLGIGEWFLWPSCNAPQCVATLIFAHLTPYP